MCDIVGAIVVGSEVGFKFGGNEASVSVSTGDGDVTSMVLMGEADCADAKLGKLPIAKAPMSSM